MNHCRAAVVRNDKPDLGAFSISRLRPRNGVAVTSEADPDPLKPAVPPTVQWDIVVEGGDAPAGHVAASSRDEGWARRVAAVINKEKRATLAEVETSIRGLLAVGY
jgi:hypothetical protein